MNINAYFIYFSIGWAKKNASKIEENFQWVHYTMLSLKIDANNCWTEAKKNSIEAEKTLER